MAADSKRKTPNVDITARCDGGRQYIEVRYLTLGVSLYLSLQDANHFVDALNLCIKEAERHAIEVHGIGEYLTLRPEDND